MVCADQLMCIVSGVVRLVPVVRKNIPAKSLPQYLKWILE